MKLLPAATHELVHYPKAIYGELYGLAADPHEYGNLLRQPRPRRRLNLASYSHAFLPP